MNEVQGWAGTTGLPKQQRVWSFKAQTGGFPVSSQLQACSRAARLPTTRLSLSGKRHSPWVIGHEGEKRGELASSLLYSLITPPQFMNLTKPLAWFQEAMTEQSPQFLDVTLPLSPSHSCVWGNRFVGASEF